jgi:hypothetical protein
MSSLNPVPVRQLAIQIAEHIAEQLFQNEPDSEKTEHSIQFVFDRLADAILSLPSKDIHQLGSELRIGGDNE